MQILIGFITNVVQSRPPIQLESDSLGTSLTPHASTHAVLQRRAGGALREANTYVGLLRGILAGQTPSD
jgi:hypothetical protein